MTNRKKSNFVGVTEIPAGASFDFTYNGTNYKVPLSVMIEAFGTTGSITSLGDPLQSPVLNKDGTENQIRVIEDGYGIKSAISSTGGITLSHNFSIGDSGQAVLIDLLTDSPVIRNLVSGDGISIAPDGNNLKITATDSTPTALNIIVVNEMSDFPTASSGVITTGDDSAYLVSAHLSTSNRFEMGSGSLIYGADSKVASLTYTGTDTMFTSVTGNSKVTLITLYCEYGMLFDISSDGTGIFEMVDTIVPICNAIGTITDTRAVQIMNNIFDNVTTGGISFYGDIGVVVGGINLFHMYGGTAYDLGTATINSGFTISSDFVNLETGTSYISGLVDSGNIVAGAVASVTAVASKGLGTPLINVLPTDDRWSFNHNDDIVDSVISILGHNGGTTVTIATSNTPVIVGGSWTFSHESRLVGDSGGVMTYTGKGAHISLSATITADLVSGTDDCTFYFYKNGVQETDSGILREFRDGDPGNIAMVWQLDVTTGDEISIYVENNDTGVDIDIINAVVGISGK